MAIYVRAAWCGDGIVSVGEVCDDGNDVDNDGCNAACELSAPLCDVDLATAPDGFVTIPGGVGTMDELWEAMSWAQLGYHDNPVGLLNAFGFYDELIAFNSKMAQVGFVRPVHQNILVHDTALAGRIDKMASYEPHTPIFQMKADDL